jgi:hypothetical protein
MNPTNTPNRPQNNCIACPACGSTYLREEEFQQYLDGPYSSVPGGELRSMGCIVRVRICLCGHVELASGLGSVPPIERATLTKSFENAHRYRAEGQASWIYSGLADIFVRRSEFEALTAQTGHLSTAIEGAIKDQRAANDPTNASK